MATWRRELDEYEANLYSVQKSGCLGLLFHTKNGEIEIKRYDDGEKRMEIELHGIKVPDGSTLTVFIDGTNVCDVAVQRGYASLNQSSLQGATIPQVNHGSVAEIHFAGEVLFQGAFKPD